MYGEVFVIVMWRDLNVIVLNFKGKKCIVLFNVIGLVEFGKFMVIMGFFGLGKIMFFDVFVGKVCFFGGIFFYFFFWKFLIGLKIYGVLYIIIILLIWVNIV